MTSEKEIKNESMALENENEDPRPDVSVSGTVDGGSRLISETNSSTRHTMANLCGRSMEKATVDITMRGETVNHPEMANVTKKSK